MRANFFTVESKKSSPKNDKYFPLNVDESLKVRSKESPLESKKNSPNNEKEAILKKLRELPVALEIRTKENPLVLKEKLQDDEKAFFLKWNIEDLKIILESIDKIQYELDKAALMEDIPTLAILAKSILDNHIMKASPSLFCIYFSNRNLLNKRLTNSLRMVINSWHYSESCASFGEYAKTLISASSPENLANAGYLIMVIEKFIEQVGIILNDIDPRNLPNLTSLIIDEAIEELQRKLVIHKLCLFPGKNNEILINLSSDMVPLLEVSKTILEYLIKKFPKESACVEFRSIAMSIFDYSKNEDSNPIVKVPAINPRLGAVAHK